MAIRRQVSVSDDVWAEIRALEYVTKETQGTIVGQALRAYLQANPSLAARVAKAKEALAA